MKGVSFQKPFEFQLQVDGESWQQGGTVQGTLVARNRGSEPISLAGTRVVLAWGTSSKIKQKSPEAFKAVAIAPDEREALASRQLKPDAEERVSWSFPLERNARVTEKSASLYLVYGREEGLEKMGQLQLNVEPEPLIASFLEIFQVQHHFLLKSRRTNSRGWVEAKLEPPEANKAFASIELLSLQLRFKAPAGGEENLEVRYSFELKKLDASAGAVAAVPDKKDFEQVLAPTDLRLPSGRVNHERMEAAAQETLGQLGLGGLPL